MLLIVVFYNRPIGCGSERINKFASIDRPILFVYIKKKMQVPCNFLYFFYTVSTLHVYMEIVCARKKKRFRYVYSTICRLEIVCTYNYHYLPSINEQCETAKKQFEKKNSNNNNFLDFSILLFKNACIIIV